MATPQMPTHLPPLRAHVREEVGHELQVMLAELLDLTLVGKQLHWNIVGPRFQPLHEELDTLVDSWREPAYIPRQATKRAL
jgi:starvation-inducible DNA-binding protein